MKEKELRLALVCYGGVSLAVYMHGVVEEVLELTRASKKLHQHKHSSATNTTDETAETEVLYRELLDALFPKVELRVVVDTISGASAGGINGIFLARALAHDLSLKPQRKMWIELADIMTLMDEETLAKRWSKFYLYPLLYFLNSKPLRKYFPSFELRNKISIFIRSRWLEPPFSGERMLTWMLDAAHAQGTNPNEGAGSDSLVPTGQPLELIVSLTNFYGKQQIIEMNDPASISEREHRTTLKFKYFRREDGKVESDFNNDNIPGLAFAARATSSYPGAFPPVCLNDLKKMIKTRNETWPHQECFMTRNGDQFKSNGGTPEKILFIDGSVVNNKPFGEVIAALPAHPAHREVDRRIIYIDPSPDNFKLEKQEIEPSFFHTIFDAVVQIPRNEPIRDELKKVNLHNQHAIKLQKIMKRLKADVDPFLVDIITPEAIGNISTPLIVSWRETVNTQAVTKAGYAYTSYLYLKLYYLLDSVTAHLTKFGKQKNNVDQTDIRAAVLLWADKNKIWGANPENLDQFEMQEVVHILRNLDVDFRVRRLRFMIKFINEAYQELDKAGDSYKDLQQLNGLKKAAYKFIDSFKSCWETPIELDLENAFSSNKNISNVTNILMKQWGLEDKDFEFDEQFSQIVKGIKSETLRLDVIRNYIGFAFHDVLTLPLLQTTDLTEIDTISVNRISPVDHSSIPWPRDEGVLLGNKFGKFGAFFQRSARENDHIWGRLNASERLVDFVINSAGAKNLPKDFDLIGFKKRLFQTILASEEPHIEAGKPEFNRIKAVIDAMK